MVPAITTCQPATGPAPLGSTGIRGTRRIGLTQVSLGVGSDDREADGRRSTRSTRKGRIDRAFADAARAPAGDTGGARCLGLEGRALRQTDRPDRYPNRRG